MPTKDFVALMLIIPALFAGIVALSAVKPFRSIVFCALLYLSAVTERLDVNFLSRDWYRGTTRGVEFSIVDILSISLLVSMVLFPKRGYKRGYWPAGFGLMILFFLYALFSVAISDPKLFGIFELSKMIRGMIMFLAAAIFIQTEKELRMLVVSLGIVVCLQGIYALKERYLDGMHRVIGLVDDPNSLSLYLCMTAPIFVAALTSNFPKWIKMISVMALLLAGVGLVLSISRTGVVTMAIVLFCAALACMNYTITAKKIPVVIVVVLCAGGILAKSWKTLETRFKESTLTQEYGKNRHQGRGYYLRVARVILAERPLGVGLNNWSYFVSNLYGPKLGFHFVPYRGTNYKPSEKIPDGVTNIDAAQAAPAHNLGALVAGELGIPGLLIFAALWLRWFQMGASFLWPRSPDPMRRMGVGIFFTLCGVFLQSLTEWVYRQTAIFYTFNILLGTLAALYFIKRREKLEELEEADEEDDELLEDEPELVRP